MEQKTFSTPTKGRFSTSKKAVGLTVIGLVCAAGVLYVVKHKQPKSQSQTPIIQKEVKYVFFSANGKPITLSEQEVYSIRQMHEDGMQPSTIGEKFGLETVMVMRIINCVKSM